MRPTIWISFLAALLASSCRSGPDAPAADPEAPLFEVVVLEHAEADRLAVTLEDFLEDAAAGSEEPPLVRADAQTNSLLLQARPEALAELKDLIARLDVPPPPAAD